MVPPAHRDRLSALDPSPFGKNLDGHLVQLRALLVQDAPAGRRLEFLLQEVNREVNTVGSKSQHVGISALVVEVKAELERIREQIQNVE